MTSLLPTPEPPDPVEGALGHFEHSNWVKQALKNLDAGTVHSNGGVATGTLLADQVTIDNPEDQTARLNLKGNSTKSVLAKTSADLNRWQLVLGDSTAEGGNHSGSLFNLFAYADDGALRHTVLKADRNSGLVEVKGNPTAAMGVATKEYVDNAMPIGAIIAFGGNAAPNGWHLCDGSAHSSTALQNVLGSPNTPDLRGRFIVAVGDSTHVDVPSVYNRGDIGGKESVRLSGAESGTSAHGHGTGTTAVGNAAHSHGGTTAYADTNHYHTGTTDEAGEHVHGTRRGMGGTEYPVHSISEMAGGWNSLPPTDAAGIHQHTFSSSWASHSPTHYHVINNDNAAHQHSFTAPTATAADAASAHENRPPYYALVYIIKKA